MINSQEPRQPSNKPNLSNDPNQPNKEFTPNQQDIFSFLQKEEKPSPSPFFSENGLSQDIIQVTQAEPDICLEVFYALYNTLWSQIESQSDVSFKDAWKRFIGDSTIKGSLCPPERLMIVKDMKELLSQNGGENQVFDDLDQAVSSISYLKEKIENYQIQILHKEEIIASLSLVQEFYQSYRSKVEGLIQAILKKEQNNFSHTSESEALEDLLEPKAIMMSDIFSHHWAYRISRNKAQKILSSNLNDPLPEEISEPLVFFKANGNPEKDFMLYSLYRHLKIPVPETALFILTDVFEENPEYSYTVQASEAVSGDSSLKAFENKETIFDHEAYVSQVIGSLLTNPSHGSFDNFKYSSKYKTFISIDNENVFKQEIAVKSILYLLPQMDLPISESIKIFFTTLDPHLATLSWLQDLSKKNREYQLLYTRLAFQRTRFLSQSEVPSNIQKDSFYPPKILLSKELLTCFVEKLQLIERIFLANRSVSLQTLFEEISPVLGTYYHKMRSEFNDPEEALLSGNKKNGQEDFHQNLLLPPEKLFDEYKNLLASGSSPLDGFIRRHSQRNKKNSLNLQVALNELKLLIQEDLINSQSPGNIIDFCHSLSEAVDNDPHLIKEITSALLNLPHPELQWIFLLEKYFPRPDSSVPSLHVVGALMRQRTFLLTESENKYLFDTKGNIKKNPSLTGRSSVTCFPKENPEFYLKQHPEWPCYELASTMFMRQLGVTHLPYQDLLIIKDSPVFLSQKVSGVPVLHAWNNPNAFNNLDPFHTTLLIISAMFINPEDGKEDNFILTPDGKYLIPIDNDHFFLPSTFQKEGNFWNAFTANTALQTKTILFCLNEMFLPIPLEVRQHILSINFDSILTKWMTELDKLENKFNNLVDQNQRSKFLEQGTVMRIPFYKQFIENLHWKAHKIQDILKTAHEITPFDLLKAVEPFVAKCYQDSFKQGNNLQARFKVVTNKLYTKSAIDGSRISVLNTHSMMEILNVSMEDLQNDVVFQRMGPLDTLEFLNHLIQERNQKAAIEQEMLYELDEKKQESQWVSLYGNPPKEAAFFTNPKEGLLLKGNKLTELFAQMPNKGMRIRFLSLPENPLLTDKEIRILTEECSNLEYLNLSGCLKLKQFVTKEREWPLLARLDAKDCLNLNKIISYCPIKILQIGTDQEIEIFIKQSTLDIFTISKKKIEFEFFIQKGLNLEIKSQGKILSNDDFLLHVIRGKEEIDRYFRNFKVHLQIPGQVFEAFSTSIDLKKSNIKTEDIQKLVLLNLRKLKGLNLSQNENLNAKSIEFLIQGDWPELNHLDLSKNPKISDEGIKVFSRGNWPLLETLNLSKTNLTVLGVEIIVNQSKWPQLKQLDLSGNLHIGNEGLEMLSEANWPFLETLDLNYSNISKKNFLHFILNTKWPNLKEISFNSIGKNAAKNLLKKYWHLPEELDLSSGQITQFDIEIIVKECNWPQLKHLTLSQNQIKDKGIEMLSQGNWPFLEILNLKKTEITATGVEAIAKRSNWLQLRHLDLSENQIKDKGAEILSQGNWPVLEILELKRTEITAVGIEFIVKTCDWPQLKCLDLSENKISDDSLEILLQGNWPLLETLKLDNTEITKKVLPKILVSSKWPRIETLTLPNSWDEADKNLALAFFKKDLSQLERLDLHDLKLQLAQIESIFKVNKPQFSKLKYLKISEDDDSCDAKISILAHQEYPLLQEVHLNNTKFSHKVLEAIQELNWRKLKYIDLSNNEIFDKGLSVLALADWPLIEQLNLRNTSITAEGFVDSISKTKWHNLKELDVSLNPIQDRGLEAIVLANLSLLETLNLSLTGITAQGFESSIKKSIWQNVKKLDVSHNQIGNEGLARIALAEWNQLEYLYSEKIEITKEGIEILIRKSHWPNLKGLDISDNEIGDEGLKTLSSGKWPLLENLYLRKTHITGKGIESMARISEWPSLKMFDLSENRVFTGAYNVLRSQKWPLLEDLNLKNTDVTGMGLHDLFGQNWRCLREVHFQNLDHYVLSMITEYQQAFKVMSPNAKITIS